VSCDVEAQWAAERSATALTNALIEALAAARADLARAQERAKDKAADGPDLNDLFGDAIALMNDPRRMMEP
jgi:membrane protein involved in colicin uptake